MTDNVTPYTAEALLRDAIEAAESIARCNKRECVACHDDAKLIVTNLRAELTRAIPATEGWRPIASAPKDGRWILLGRAGSGVRPFIGRYGKRAFSWFDERDTIRDPDLWQPLPEPPHEN